MNQQKSERDKFREQVEAKQNEVKLNEAQKKIDYVNASFERMKGLRAKEAWRSFLFLRGELKKAMRGWKEQINHPDTPENRRVYFIGCVYGANFIFQISQNFIDMKKDIETGKAGNILRFFKGGN